ncbi:molybdate ABC transporter substrate-binding protein [Labrys neptuniae]
MADFVRVLAAGSLRHALPEIAAAFEAASGIAVSVSLGPAGLLRERIEAGESFDLFASANMAHPRRLCAGGLAEEVFCFARNRLCLLARADLGLTSGNIVDVLSGPSTRIGISTPGDDPSGDYAFEMFDLIEVRHPGVGASLKHRALQLVGGRYSPPGRNPAGLIGEGVVDLFLSYASNARFHEKDSALSVVSLPPEISPRIDYGLAQRTGANEGTVMLRDFLLSAQAQQILERAGFAPKDQCFAI